MKSSRFVGLLACLALFMGLLSSSSAQALLPAEKNLFVLDVSGSTDFRTLWNFSLRPSIVNKLKQPFGFPEGATKSGKPVSPVDITIFAISGNSYDEPILPIVTSADANELWAVVDDVGFNPSKARLKEISDAIFGGKGIFTMQSEYLRSSPLKVPNLTTCEKESAETLRTSTSGFLRDAEPNQRKQIAQVVCKLANRIALNLRTADEYFKTPHCPGKGKPCSDIFGAIVRASDVARDLAIGTPSGSVRPSMCIAIASDMLHNDYRMKKDSILNSREIARTATKTEAFSRGKLAAQAIDLKFPSKSKLNLRIVVLGQGTGTNPLSIEYRSILNSYWNGVWQQAGVAETGVTTSLDRACQGSA
jgi:hypothetical protein